MSSNIIEVESENREESPSLRNEKEQITEEEIKVPSLHEADTYENITISLS